MLEIFINFFVFFPPSIAEAMDFRNWCESESVRLTGTKGIISLHFSPTCSIFLSDLIFDGLGVSHRIRMLKFLVYKAAKILLMQ